MSTALVGVLALCVAATPWELPARQYYDAFHAFHAAGHRSQEDFEHLADARRRAASALPANEVLLKALEGDGHTAAREEALAGIAASQTKEAVLLRGVVGLSFTGLSTTERLLAVSALGGAPPAWIHANGSAISKALESESEPDVIVLASLYVLPSLGADAYLPLAARFIRSGDQAARRVLLSQADAREGRRGVLAIARELERLERPDLANEARRVADGRGKSVPP